MKQLLTLVFIATLWLVSSAQTSKDHVKIAGAMHRVMWKGELAGLIKLDTIENKEGLYGIGPLSYLQGELLINNGKCYVSKVLTDSTMLVEETFDVSAPFFVYGNVTHWQEVQLPTSVNNIKQLEHFVDSLSKDDPRPFVFKVQTAVTHAVIHIQDLPAGTKVSSPKEAHQGQVDYDITDTVVEIVGFFSTEHQGVFTHHDSYQHLHLITSDKKMMGHVDHAEFEGGTLYLPKYK